MKRKKQEVNNGTWSLKGVVECHKRTFIVTIILCCLCICLVTVVLLSQNLVAQIHRLFKEE